MNEPLKNLALLAGTIAVLFIALEIFARYVLPPVSRVNFTAVPNTIKVRSQVPGIRYLLRGNGVATQDFKTDPRGYFDDGARLTYRTNSSGFRGPDVAVAKTEDMFRVIGLGDSFTFGTGVRNQDTYLSVAQRMLNQMASDEVFEIMNFGVPGYDTVDEGNLLLYRGLAYQPDLVIICFFLNDASGGGTAREFNRSAPIDEQPFWRRSSRFLDYVAFLIERRQAADIIAQRYRESVQQDAPGWIRAQRSLTQVKNIADERDFDLILMIFPVLWGLSDEYPFKDVHAKVAAFALQEGIPILDLAPEFVGFDGPELWVHPNNQHPNEIAHGVAGRALARFIAAQ